MILVVITAIVILFFTGLIGLEKFMDAIEFFEDNY